MIKLINIQTATEIPTGHDLVVLEKGDPDSALVLYGFDEVGIFDSQFTNPVYGFAPTI